jgi:hypothetical protein
VTGLVTFLSASNGAPSPLVDAQQPKSRTWLDYWGRVLVVYAVWVALWIAGQFALGVVLQRGAPDPTGAPWGLFLSLLPIYYFIHFVFLAPVAAVIALIPWVLRRRNVRRRWLAVIGGVIWGAFFVVFVHQDGALGDARLYDGIRWAASGLLFGAMLPYPAGSVRRRLPGG